MKAEVVCYNDADGQYALYLDGKMHIRGDEYHDNIKGYIDGFLEGLKYAKIKVKVSSWLLSEESMDRFFVAQCDIPKKHPNPYTLDLVKN